MSLKADQSHSCVCVCVQNSEYVCTPKEQASKEIPQHHLRRFWRHHHQLSAVSDLRQGESHHHIGVCVPLLCFKWFIAYNIAMFCSGVSHCGELPGHFPSHSWERGSSQASLCHTSNVAGESRFVRWGLRSSGMDCFCSRVHQEVRICVYMHSICPIYPLIFYS